MSEPGWEAAVNWPLPAEPSIELLQEARQRVATYIDWYSNDAAPVTAPVEVRHEINRAAARLIEICLAIQQQQLASER